ncbi:hypothetical protein PY310_21215, partial [Pseudarthrobacter sp. H3Y2-7]|uniref:hypothetical protein n=1 Tax=Pseudarthrobacter naphthalenicus TaxID=3031328 RepID=UPI0023AF736C
MDTDADRSKADITKRIEELDHEWDVERLLELDPSSLAFIGTVLEATTNRKWLLLPATVLAFLFQHAVQGSKDRFMVNSPGSGLRRRPCKGRLHDHPASGPWASRRVCQGGP